MHVGASALPSRLLQDEFLKNKKNSVTLCTKLVDLSCCNVLAFSLVNVASLIVSARVSFLTVMRRTRIVVSFFKVSIWVQKVF